MYTNVNLNEDAIDVLALDYQVGRQVWKKYLQRTKNNE
jgi:hypothetical protein